MKKTKNNLSTRKILIIFFLLVLLIFISVGIYDFATKRNIELMQSKCHTQLQPSNFFLKDKFSFSSGNGDNSITVQYGLKYNEYLKMGFEGNNSFSFEVPSKFSRCCGSMRPAISDNSILLFKKVMYKDELKIGDVVSYYCNNQLYLHRIIEIKENEFIIKGDNNEDNDKIAFGCNATYDKIENKLIAVFY